MTQGTQLAPGPRLFASHRLFLALLTLGALVRLATVVAFPPGFVFSDGPTYLDLVDHLTTLPDRTVGYGVLLHVLAWASRDVSLIIAVQHLLGLATGGLVYLLLLRWGVSTRCAALASVPVLFDGMELVVEHSVLSDVVFDFLVVAGVAVLAWHRRPTTRTAAVAGLVLGVAVCVRVVGQPLVVAAVLFCLVASATLRHRLITSAAVIGAFLVPLAAYATWYHADHGAWALSQSSGRALYMRTTSFVDCARLDLPSYEQQLCPEEPVGHRQDPTYYGWHDPDGDHGLTPPDGITPDQAMHDFAMKAIRAQPGDYLRTVARDFAYNFAIVRVDKYGYDTADKWSFYRYLTLQPTDWTRPGYAAHGGVLPTVRQPYAFLLVAYGGVVFTSGPLLLGLLLLALAGLVVPRGGETAGTRPLILLVTSIGVGLALAPDVTAEFVWRYQLPMVVLIPMGAALAWVRLTQSSPAQPGTAATPRTDWPNGGVTRRSRNRVVGTSSRS